MLAPTLIGIFFAVLVNHAFGSSNEEIYIHTRSDGKLFNLARLKFVICCLLTMLPSQLQNLVTALADVCIDLNLTIRLN